MKYKIELNEDFDLKVGAHIVHIKFVDSSNDSISDENHGAWVPRKYTIFLYKEDPYSMKLSSLFHEVIHVFEYFYDIKIPHKDLNLMGDAFAQVFLDNFKEGE